MKRFSLLFIICSFCANAVAADLSGSVYWEGFKKSFSYLGQGSVLQFKEKNNLYIAAIAAPSLWYAFDQDKRISNHERTKHIPKLMQFSSDLAPVLGFPVISFATFTLGTKKDDPKMVQFAMEYFGAMYLAFIETAAMSLIDVHERPDPSHTKKIETALRGKSSFPSGHVVPYAALTFKAFQFYGPYMALAPAALTVLTSMQRIRDGKHYLSDVLGGVFLSAFASEGVRRAGGYKENHPLYKSIFEHDVVLGIIEHEGAIGPRVTFFVD